MRQSVHGPAEQDFFFVFFVLKPAVKPFLAPNFKSVLNYELNKTKSSKHAAFTQRTLHWNGAGRIGPDACFCFVAVQRNLQPETKEETGVSEKGGVDEGQGQDGVWSEVLKNVEPSGPLLIQ